MAYLTSTFTARTNQKGAFSGILAWINEDWSAAKRIFYPPTCSAIEGRPSRDVFVNRTYIVGGHTQNIIIDEMFRASAQGITPPIAPSLSAGAGTTAQIGYLRFYDEITGERSSLSPGSATVTGSTSRTWTNLPTVVPGEIIPSEGNVTIDTGYVNGLLGVTNFHDLRPGDRIAIDTDLTRWATIRSIQSSTFMIIDDDGMAGVDVTIVVKPVSRISHVELWVSVGGALPRFILRVRIGTTSVTESVATLALGEALVDTYEPMPRGSYNVIYNSRQIVAGVPGQLDRVFISLIGFPERYGGLNFQTKYGEPVVGLIRTRDYVICVCPDSSYRLQGFTEDDFVLVGLEPKIGGIGHSGNAVCGGRVFIPSREQIQIFDGAFHDAMPSRSREWTKNLRDFADAFQMGRGIVDPDGQTYRFLPFPVRRPSSGELVVESAADPDECTAVGLGDLSEIVAPRVYVISSSTPFIYYYSSQQEPTLHAVPVQVSTGAVMYGREGFGAWIAAATGSVVVLKKMIRGLGPDEVATFDGSGVNFNGSIGSIEEYGGATYIAINRATLKYENLFTGITVDDITGADQDDFNDGLLIALGGDLYRLMRTSPQPSFFAIRRLRAGVWTDVTVPAPFNFECYLRDAVRFRNAIYFCDHTSSSDNTGRIGRISLSSTGTTQITLQHSFAGGAGAINPMAIRAMCVFNDILYWVGSYGDGIHIGSYDGTETSQGGVFNNNAKNLSSQFGYLTDLQNPGRVYFFGGFEGKLRLCMSRAQTEGQELPCPVNWFSPLGDDISGTWVSHEMWHTNELIEESFVRLWGIF